MENDRITKILFISHDASRTGAPIALLRLMQELKKQKNVSIATLLPYGGPLLKDFEHLGKVFLWKKPHHLKFYERMFYRVLWKLSPVISQKHLNDEILTEVKKADLIFNNTMTTHCLLAQLPLVGKRVFTYIHESNVVAKFHATKNEMQFLESISERVYLPASSAGDYLIKKYGYEPKKISVLPAIIPKINSEGQRLSSGKFNIGLCGVFGIRKGSDLLSSIGQVLKQKKISDVKLHWLGVDFSSIEFLLIEEDLKKLGLSHYFVFHDKMENINPALSQMDLFLLLSREDTFPLVVLEAAQHGIPTICFKDAGGIQDFVRNDAGICVDFLNIEQVVDGIVELSENRTLLLQKGRIAKERVQTHLDAKSIVESLWKDLKANA